MTLSEYGHSAQSFAKALFGSPKYRYSADEYQITVVQAVGNEVMQNQYNVSRYVLEDCQDDDMLQHVCITLDRGLLDAAGFVSEHRLWGSSPVIGGMPMRHPTEAGIYILNGPHGGNYYHTPPPGYMLYIPMVGGSEAEYSVRLTQLGWVGVYARGAYA